MGITENLAESLARDTVEAAEKLGHDTLIDEISKSLGASSQPTQEAFMTAVRVIMAEKRARAMLNAKIDAALKKQQAAPDT